MNPQQFFQAKVLELQQRHVKYEDTPYSPNPIAKKACGLRDLQVILWVAKAAGLGNSWAELATRGLITATEALSTQNATNAHLKTFAYLFVHPSKSVVKIALFTICKCHRCHLWFSNHGSRASEYLMQRYYWAAKAVIEHLFAEH